MASVRGSLCGLLTTLSRQRCQLCNLARVARSYSYSSVTASNCDPASSFPRIARMCDRTVATETTSSSAIDCARRPRAKRSRTARSRSLSLVQPSLEHSSAFLLIQVRLDESLAPFRAHHVDPLCGAPDGGDEDGQRGGLGDAGHAPAARALPIRASSEVPDSARTRHPDRRRSSISETPSMGVPSGPRPRSRSSRTTPGGSVAAATRTLSRLRTVCRRARRPADCNDMVSAVATSSWSSMIRTVGSVRVEPLQDEIDMAR